MPQKTSLQLSFLSFFLFFFFFIVDLFTTMSDSEEEDYMSLKFLEGAEQYEKERKQASYSEKRKQQLREQEKKAYIKPRAVLEKEEREKGLETSVSSDNKGMKMLMKMGFK
jgi:hypothetical protein